MVAMRGRKWIVILAFGNMLGARAAVAQGKPADCAPAGASTEHQPMNHLAHLTAMLGCEAVPSEEGQSAYAAIAEIVRLLDADSTTDWSKVDIEALRRHLVDMDEVTMHSSATQRDTASGIIIDVTGAGETVGAIRRMMTSHMAALAAEGLYKTQERDLPNGAQIRVTIGDPRDARRLARLRALGFAGLLTEGDHHALHHIGIARGETLHHDH